MYIARPATGFEIIVRHQDDLERIEEFKNQSEANARCWDGIVSRLKMSAHKDGESAPQLGDGCRILVVGPDHEAGTPRIMIGYLALGDWVSIRIVCIGDQSRRDSFSLAS